MCIYNSAKVSFLLTDLGGDMVIRHLKVHHGKVIPHIIIIYPKGIKKQANLKTDMLMVLEL